MKFSERMGILKVKDVIQVAGMDKELRNSLWNVYYHYFGEAMFKDEGSREDREKLSSTFTYLWWHYWGKDLNEIPHYLSDKFHFIHKYFLTCQWYEVYDLLETIVTVNEDLVSSKFMSSINIFLTRHLSGFRFVNGKVAPIVSEVEVEAIQVAIDGSFVSKYKGVSKHLTAALETLSQKPIGDYRTSIKESISALESLCLELSGEKEKFGAMMTKLGKEAGIHQGLLSGFKSLYGFTSDEGGIRHAMLDEPDLGQEDAIYMLVSCSAFINYVNTKFVKAKVQHD